MSKANISVAMIARNAEKTIHDCVRSIAPYVAEVVVCVDVLSNDKTAYWARKAGAIVHTKHPVSEWHECGAHGKVLAQNFAKARDASFSLCSANTEWLMWLDSDDVVKGADRLAEFISKVPDNVGAVWLPYHYSQTPNGQTATLFDRERILRRSVGWHWFHRVHEVAVPDNCPMEHVQQARTDAISIWHQDTGHHTETSAKRNILLLEIELEEKPGDPWALFYLGNQYFALGQWSTAIQYYQNSLQCNNPYQVWQSWIYMSMAFERLGDMDNSNACAYHAMDVAPYHPEPYYRLAAVAMWKNDVQRCEFWTRLGDGMQEPPSFAFRNPMDKPYNARVTLSQAYSNAGMISKAAQELERAIKIIPQEDCVKALAEFRQQEQESKLANSWVDVITDATASNIEFDKNELPDSIWKFGRIRDIIVPKMISVRANTQPRIIFWCGKSVEPWSSESINTTGIGGSETAVIEVAKRLAHDGWLVDVYNDPDRYEGEYDGVGYWGCDRLRSQEKAEVLVSWRNPQVHPINIQRNLSLLWCHDLNKGGGAAEDFKRWDIVLGVSAWHSVYLQRMYGVDKVGYVPNGINLDRFDSHMKKVPFRCVYASSPDRGLDTLLQLWSTIVDNEPSAELHIAYGWETVDKTMAMMPAAVPQLLPMKQKIMALIEKSKGVVWRGRLSQLELAKLYQESYCWLYPTSFLEVSCISAMEAMAGGCVPVVSAAGALPETIGDAGLIVTGNTYSSSWKEYWLQCARGVLHTPQIREGYMKLAIERAKLFSWDEAYEKHWKPLLVDVGAKELVTA